MKNQNTKLKKYLIFGKAIENLKNKADITFVNNRKDYVKWSFRPSFKGEKNFSMD